jgi:hypothetical protein
MYTVDSSCIESYLGQDKYLESSSQVSKHPDMLCGLSSATRLAPTRAIVQLASSDAIVRPKSEILRDYSGWELLLFPTMLTAVIRLKSQWEGAEIPKTR